MRFNIQHRGLKQVGEMERAHLSIADALLAQVAAPRPLQVGTRKRSKIPKILRSFSQLRLFDGILEQIRELTKSTQKFRSF
jgi:hypothetical protein